MAPLIIELLLLPPPAFNLGAFASPIVLRFVVSWARERERAPLKIHSAFLLLNLWYNINSSPIPPSYCVAQGREEEIGEFLDDKRRLLVRLMAAHPSDVTIRAKNRRQSVKSVPFAFAFVLHRPDRSWSPRRTDGMTCEK